MSNSISAAESATRTQRVALAVRTEQGTAMNGSSVAVGAGARRQEEEYSTEGEEVKTVSTSYYIKTLKCERIARDRMASRTEIQG